MNGIDIKLIDYREHKRIYRRMSKEEGKKLERILERVWK